MTIPDNCDTILNYIHKNMPESHEAIGEYLLEMVERFSSRQCYHQIIGEISIIAVSTLTQDGFRTFVAHCPNPDRVIQEVINEAKKLIWKKELKNAAILLEYILPYAEVLPDNQKPAKILSFRDFIEYAYYMSYISPESDLLVHPYLGTEILLIQGKYYAEKREADKAISIFNGVIRISPVNCQVLFELAEVYRDKGNMEEYRTITELCFTYAWKPEDLAHAYRNMGYFFTDSGDYEGAVTCYLMGTTWEDSPITTRELAYIREKTGNFSDISYYVAEGKKILSDRNVPFGPNPDMIDLMMTYADECRTEGNFFEARKYLSRVKALQLSDDLEQQITAIERFIEDTTIF
ncbi:MAG: hypothetical protein GXY48_01035 [Methanomicrobiales archaeon]|nr:hypothetical protein [Methanomicrobiales archaeon]